MRTERGIRQVAVYVMLAYDTNGYKDILGLWINETESKHVWMKIFDELKSRGIEDLGILSIDGVSGLEEGAKAIFSNITVQRCIVHLIRNSIRYVPRKQWSSFTKQLKEIYGAINAEEARRKLKKFKQDWQDYPGAVTVWENNFQQVEQIFNYGSAVRKVMYTTNAIESVNASFRKVTKKGTFPNEDAIFKIFYLRIVELYKKWNSHSLANWAMIRNQLLIDERMGNLMKKYDKEF